MSPELRLRLAMKNRNVAQQRLNVTLQYRQRLKLQMLVNLWDDQIDEIQAELGARLDASRLAVLRLAEMGRAEA